MTSTSLTLENETVRLEPLTLAHVPALVAAASGDRSSFSLTWVPDGEEQTLHYVEVALAQQAAGNAEPYAVVDAVTGDVVGSTRLWDFERFDPAAVWPQALELGFTWYSPRVQRTGLNTAAKFLLLRRAFDDWSALRVRLKTDARNVRSRAAIERLGATFEGVLRVVSSNGGQGLHRDAAYYSILRAEWPAAKAGLEVKLRR